jgi:hypothetical protein
VILIYGGDATRPDLVGDTPAALASRNANLA